MPPASGRPQAASSSYVPLPGAVPYQAAGEEEISREGLSTGNGEAEFGGEARGGGDAVRRQGMQMRARSVTQDAPEAGMGGVELESSLEVLVTFVELP